MKFKRPILFRHSRPGEKWPGIRPTHPVGWMLLAIVITGFVVLCLDLLKIYSLVPSQLRSYFLVGILLLNLLNVGVFCERPGKADRK